MKDREEPENSDTNLLQMETTTRSPQPTRKTCFIIAGVVSFIVLVVIITVIVVTVSSKNSNWVYLPCDQPESSSCPAGFDQKNPPLILVSMDGFRAKYLLDYKKFTPNLQKIRECGVHVSHMRASYPTKTFPNHYTLVTGLFPESHGIVDNTMLDEKIGAPFFLSSPVSKDPRWWGGDPIWNTVTNQSKLSATMFWPGSDVKIGGQYPKYWKMYDKKFSFQSRLNKVFEWLDKPSEERPSLITLYFEEPDSTGHAFGTTGEKIESALKDVDSYIGKLMDGLLARGLHNCVNIILLADHGMKNMPCENVIKLSKYINVTDMFIRGGSFGWINNELYLNKEKNIMKNTNPQSVPKLLKELQCSNCKTCDRTSIRPLLKTSLPKRFHYSNNNRIPSIIIDLDAGYQVTRYSTKECGNRGGHGYDNADPSMWAIFLGYGPHFKQGAEMEPFLNIEVYNLMSDLIGVKPSPNNGTQGSLYRLLRNPPPITKEKSYPYGTCPFPATIAEVDNRLNMASCNCDLWPGSEQKSKLAEYANKLNISKATEEEYKKKQMPFGAPKMLVKEDTCVIAQEEYILGYSNDYKTPLWAGYKIEKTTSPNLNKNCSHPDVRIDPANVATCSDYASDKTADPAQLFIRDAGGNTEKAVFDIFSMANTMPMMNNTALTWTTLVKTMMSYEKVSKSLYFFTGPIFDYNADGLRDKYTDIKLFLNNGKVPVPTHSYIILYRCPENVDCSQQQKWQSMAVIMDYEFSHKAVLCFSDLSENINFNLARVRDVELLTGLEFFPEMEQLQAIRMRTYIQDEVWPGLVHSR